MKEVFHFVSLHSLFTDIQLYPRQITAAALILLLLKFPLGAALLANNPRIGKTTSALYALQGYLKFREAAYPTSRSTSGILLSLKNRLCTAPASSFVPAAQLVCERHSAQFTLTLYYDNKQRALAEDWLSPDLDGLAGSA